MTEMPGKDHSNVVSVFGMTIRSIPDFQIDD